MKTLIIFGEWDDSLDEMSIIVLLIIHSIARTRNESPFLEHSDSQLFRVGVARTLGRTIILGIEKLILFLLHL